MIVNVYILSIIFSLFFLVVIIELVRKNKLLEKYSLLWILFGILLLVMSLSPVFMEKIAGLLDIKYAPSVLFLFGMVYMIIFNLHITTVVSKQSQQITRLNQEIAILKEKSNKQNGKEEF